MIPTRYKEKLPKFLSYPIGAEALTDGLSGAPHVDSFRLWFWRAPLWPGSRYQRTITENRPYQILVSKYEPAHKPGYAGANSLIESGWYDEKWELTVYSVVREMRHLANRLLREQGLTWVVGWLRSSEQTGWLERQQRIELIFNPAEKLIAAQKISGV